MKNIETVSGLLAKIKTTVNEVLELGKENAKLARQLEEMAQERKFIDLKKDSDGTWASTEHVNHTHPK